MSGFNEFVLIEHQNNEIKSIHIVKYPKWGEPHGKRESPYWQIGTYESFRNYWLQKIFSAKVYPASIQNGPRYFTGRQRDEWEQDRKMWAEAAKNLIKSWKDQYTDKPVHYHDNMWKFYEFIKWDYKKKKFSYLI